MRQILNDHSYYEGANMAADNRVFNPDVSLVEKVSVSVAEGLRITFSPTEQYKNEEYDFSFFMGGIALESKRGNNGDYVLRIPVHIASRKISVIITDREGESLYTAYNLKHSFYSETDEALKMAIARLENLSEGALEYQNQN